MTWKRIWPLRVPLPLWCAKPLDAATTAHVCNCALVVIVAAAVPWRHV